MWIPTSLFRLNMYEILSIESTHWYSRKVHTVLAGFHYRFGIRWQSSETESSNQFGVRYPVLRHLMTENVIKLVDWKSGGLYCDMAVLQVSDIFLCMSWKQKLHDFAQWSLGLYTMIRYAYTILCQSKGQGVSNLLFSDILGKSTMIIDRNTWYLQIALKEELKVEE